MEAGSQCHPCLPVGGTPPPLRHKQWGAVSLILSGLLHSKAGSPGLDQFSVRSVDVWDKASQIDHTASDKACIQSSAQPHLVHQDQKASLGNRARNGSAPTHFPPPASVCNLESSQVTSGKSSEGQMGSDSAQKSCRCQYTRL